MIAVWVKASIRRSTIAAAFLYLCAFDLSQLIFGFFFQISFYAMIMENQIFCSRYAGSIWKIRQTCLSDFILVSR